MSKTLILGGTGFLGSHLTDLLKQSQDVLTVGSKDIDLLNLYDLNILLKNYNPDTIYHLAAFVGGIGLNRDHPGDMFYHNMQMGLNVVEAFRIHHVKHKNAKLTMVGTVCFPEDTMIRTKSRYKFISTELQEVTSHNLKDRKVKNNIINRYSGLMYNVTISGSRIQCTPEHPIFTSIGFIEAKNLKKGNLVVVPIYRPKNIVQYKLLLSKDDVLKYNAYNEYKTTKKATDISNKTKISKHTIVSWNKYKPKITNIPAINRIINGDLAWLTGAFIGDGWIEQNNKFGRGSKYYIKFSPGFDNEFTNKIINKFKNVWGEDLKCTTRKTSNILAIGSKHICKFYNDCYSNETIHRAETKIVPEYIMNSSDTAIKHFLKGYWEADGHIGERTNRSKQYIATCTSTSYELMWQIKELLLRCGIHSGLHKRKNKFKTIIQGRTVNCNDSWSIRITGKWAIKFITEVIESSVDGTYINRNNDPIVYYDYALYPIKKISTFNYDGNVYNLSVDIDETYIANGIAVHNCSYPKYAVTPFYEANIWDGYPEETNAPYGVAKRALHVMCDAYRRQFGCNIIYAIPSNLYGPRDNFDLESSHVIPALIAKIDMAKELNHDHVELWGTGLPTREFLYVEDCAKMLSYVTEVYNSAEDGFDPINLAVNADISIKDLAEKIKSLIGYDGQIIWNASKPDGQPVRRVSNNRLLNMGYSEPTVSLTEGLQRTYEWYRTNKSAIWSK